MQERSRSLTTVVGLGIAAALFLALMSMFYLQQIPGQDDLDRLEADLRREHGLFLASAAPVDISLLRPKGDQERTGVRVVCTMRPDIAKRPKTVEAYLDRIAESVLEHPNLKGRIAYARVEHAPPLEIGRTRWAKKDVAKGS